MNKLLYIGAVVASMAGASGAVAATFNFDQNADDFKTIEGFEGTWDQAVAANGSIATDGGVSITSITADWTRNVSGQLVTSSADAFLDADRSTGTTNGELTWNAGLGVCHSGFTDTSTDDGGATKYSDHGGYSNCATGGGVNSIYRSDDNLTVGETVTINFDAFVLISELMVYKGDHSQINATPAIEISTDGTTFATYDASVSSVDLTGLGASNSFTFRTLPNGIPQIYLTSMTVAQEVPLPAGAVLLLTGLGGLAAARRRWKA